VSTEQAAVDVAEVEVQGVMKKLLLVTLFATGVAQAATRYDIHYGQFTEQFQQHGVLRSAEYQNQPEFSLDAKRLLWTAHAGDGDLATDIRYLELANPKSPQTLRTTPFGEFSATALANPAGSYSVVRVEKDGTQRIWRISEQDEQLFVDLPGVGYHVWGEHGDLLLFLLEDKTGPNRAAYRKADGTLITLNSHIGRALAHIPATELFYFTAPAAGQTAQSPLWLWQYDASTNRTTQIAPMPPAGIDLAVTAQGQLWASAGTALYALKNQQWQKVADLGKHCQGKVSRFKFHRQQPLLAFVCEKESV